MLILANNTLLAYPDSRKVYKALKELELITVMDYWLTPTAMLADYVLPTADWLERPTLTNTYGCSDFAICSERAVQPAYERRTDYQFWKGLGDRLGQSDFWPWDTLEEAKYYRVYPLGYDVSSYDEFVEQVRFSFPEREYYKYGRLGFATPSGKVELYSQTLEELGYDPMPSYIGPSESEDDNPELAKEFPLTLIAGSGIMPYYHSEHRNIKPLRYLHPEPRMQINPSTAKELGIKNGDWAWIETKRGRIRQVAELTEIVHPRTIFVERGWWFPERDGREPELYGLWQSNCMKGLRIRCTGGGVLGVKAVGADPISMPMGDVYVAAKKGMIDALISPLETLEGWKHHEIFEYSTFVPHFYSEFFHITMNWDKWNSLPKDLQDAFDAVAKDAVEMGGAVWEYNQKHGMDFAKEGPGGHKFIYLSKAEVIKLKKTVAHVRDQYIEKLDKQGLPGKKIVNGATKIVEKYNQKRYKKWKPEK